jgi:hypothetical protein
MNDPMGDSPVIQRAPARKPAAKKAKKPVRRVARAVEHADVHVTRNSPRPAPRAEAARDASRDPARKAVRNGAVIAVGHGGETLTRRRTTVGDAFAVPMNEIPTGWTYQWNTVTVLNQNLKEIERGDLMMHENGWRPVPASRHPGRWAPHGYEGSIIIDGLRLEERPASLTNEALEEDKARGKAQVRDRTDALRLTQKQLPGADQARNSRVGPGMGMRMSIDPALDIPRPQHEIDDGFFED